MSDSTPCACHHCRLACLSPVPLVKVCSRAVRWHSMRLSVSLWCVPYLSRPKCMTGGAICFLPVQTVLRCISIQSLRFFTASMAATHSAPGRLGGQRFARECCVSWGVTAPCDQGNSRNSRCFMGLVLRQRLQRFCANCLRQSTG